MKSNELMVNDWVYHNKVGNTKIIAIDNGGIENWEEKHLIYEHIFPVPLTEEILKVNGFDSIKDGDVITSWRQKDNEIGKEEYDISIYRSENQNSFDLHIHSYIGSCGEMQLWICYVHELQHALRLCGLVELADNFKLE